MDKRGLSQVFKYILVALAGAVILIFFINFAYQQISLKEDLNSAVFSRLLNSNFDSFSISSNADKTIDLGREVELHFNEISNSFSCGKVGVDNVQPISNNNIIFAPRDVNTDKLNLWTARWSMPFAVVNFFYVLGDDTRLNIVGTNPFAKELRGDLNNVEFIPKRFFTNADNVKTIYVQQASRNVGVNEVLIYGFQDCEEEKDNHLCRGRAKFSNGDKIFLGKEMMYAAMFSNSLEDYQCGVNRGFVKLTKIVELYQSKANSLPSCDDVRILGRELDALKNLNLDSDVDEVISKINNFVELNKQVRSNCGNYLF